MKEFALGFRNIMRNPLRSFSTGLSLILGYVGLVSVIGYNERWTETLSTASQFFQYKGTVAIFREGAIGRLPYSDDKTTISPSTVQLLLAEFASEERIEHLSQGLYGTGLVSNGCETAPFVGIGIETQTQRWMMSRDDVRFWGRDLIKGQRGEYFFESASEAPGALSYGLASALKKNELFSGTASNKPVSNFVDCSDTLSMRDSHLGSDVQLLSKTFDRRIGAIDIDVVNHFTTGMAHLDDKSLIVPLESLQTLFETDRVSFVAVYLHDRGERFQFVQDWDDSLRKKGLMAYAYDDPELSPFDSGIMNFLRVMGLFFVGLIGFVVAIAVINAVSLTFIDRQSEIGTLRAIGFSNHDLARQMTVEVIVLATFSLFIGYLAQLGLEGIVNQANIQFRPPGFARTVQFLVMPSLETRWGGAVGLLALIVLSSYMSVRVHCRKKTIELLNPSTH